MPLEWCSNVSSWLRTVLTAPDKQRPVFPQQPTFQVARPLSSRLRLLYPQEQTSLVVPPFV